MSPLLLRPISYRHVVFPDLTKAGERPVNFAPAQNAPEQDGAAKLSSDEYECVQWIFEQAGLNADQYRRETLRRRIPACLRCMRVETLADVRLAILRNPELVWVALSALLIGVTSFFRDPGVFWTLRESVLPELLKGSTGPRVWSAGCSDGAELYSVAMLLAERRAIDGSTLFGTDCRANAVAMAREGCYDTVGIKNVPADVFSRYFRFDDGGWRVLAGLRAATQWRCGDLLMTCEPEDWDMILCRNVGIYMQTTVALCLWARLEQSLRPGGILVLGKAERPVGTAGLRLIAPCIYQRNRS
jgi:chemotaxis methyl-accepting protein methylase